MTDADFFLGVSTLRALAAISLYESCCCWIIIQLLESIVISSAEWVN